MDVYGYCLDDPINFYDRTGLEGKSEAKNSSPNNAKRKEETNKSIKDINKINAASNSNKTKIKATSSSNNSQYPSSKSNKIIKDMLWGAAQDGAKCATLAYPTGPIGAIGSGLACASAGMLKALVYDIIFPPKNEQDIKTNITDKPFNARSEVKNKLNWKTLK